MAEDEARFFGSTPTVTRCGVPGCEDWRHEGTADECRVAFAEHEQRKHPLGRRSHRHRSRAELRTEALARAAVRFPDPDAAPAAVVPASSSDRNGGGVSVAPAHAAPGRKRWTEETALDALRGFCEREGHPPAVSDLRGDPGLPSLPTIRVLFGGLADVVVRLGYPRPTRATRYSRRPAEQVPEPAAGAAEEPAAGPGPLTPAETLAEPSAPVERLPEPRTGNPETEAEATVRTFLDELDPEPSARAALLKIIDGLVDLVDVYYPEPEPGPGRELR